MKARLRYAAIPVVLGTVTTIAHSDASITLDESSLRLIATVDAVVCGRTLAGAGIVLGQMDSALYIATARHTVRKECGEATNVEVRLRFFPAETRSARVLNDLDEIAKAADLAVLKVILAPGESVPAAIWQHRGSTAHLASGTKLASVGNGFGPFTPHPAIFDRLANDRIYFASQSVSPGDSGGGLFDEHGDLVGMVRGGADENAQEAILLDRIVDRFTQSGLPVSLKRLQAPEIVSLVASSPAIAHGSSTNITWSTQNATQCAIGSGVGLVPTSGSVTVRPSSTTDYVLTCSGLGGTKKQPVTVTVTPPVAIETFSATPADIKVGESSTLQWKASNATTCRLDREGTQSTEGALVVKPTRTTSYVLECDGPGGPVARTTRVALSSDPVRITEFSASRTRIQSGTETTLRWQSSNASTCRIDNGVGRVPTRGSRRVQPNATIDYTLTCEGERGTDEETVQVTVENPNIGGHCCDVYYGVPRCVLTTAGVVGSPCICFGLGSGVICK